jgi:glycosyltransferase involved in cell wall biosynthesis
VSTPLDDDGHTAATGPLHCLVGSAPGDPERYASAMNARGSDPAHPRVVALVPAHDEAPRIAAVVRGASAHLPVLVVDDGSADDTAAVARDAGAEVLEHRPNAGKGAALRAGFRIALERGCEGVLTLDGDGQHDPAEIPAFLAAFGAGWSAEAGSDLARPDLVVGCRDFGRMPPVRRVANTLGGRAFSWAVGTHVPDNQSGYRLVGRRLMEAALASDERGFEFEVEMLATCIARGWPVAWVPIRTIYAGGPSHIRPMAHVRHFFRAGAAARRTVRRSGGSPGA